MSGGDKHKIGGSHFNLSRWALDHVALTRYFIVVLNGAGLCGLFQLGRDEDPPFTFRAMVIRTYWPGATAEQVAQQVTDKIERTLQEVPYADKISSYSRNRRVASHLQVKDYSPFAPREVPQLWYTVRKKWAICATPCRRACKGRFLTTILAMSTA